MKIIVGDGAANVDQVLVENVALANKWYRQLKNGQSYGAIAAQAGTSKRRVQQIIDLAFLAPDIVRDIANGTQPVALASYWCLRHELPAAVESATRAHRKPMNTPLRVSRKSPVQTLGG